MTASAEWVDALLTEQFGKPGESPAGFMARLERERPESAESAEVAHSIRVAAWLRRQAAVDPDERARQRDMARFEDETRRRQLQAAVAEIEAWTPRWAAA